MAEIISGRKVAHYEGPCSVCGSVVRFDPKEVSYLYMDLKSGKCPDCGGIVVTKRVAILVPKGKIVGYTRAGTPIVEI